MFPFVEISRFGIYLFSLFFSFVFEFRSQFELFASNFKKYESDASEAIKSAGPKVAAEAGA